MQRRRFVHTLPVPRATIFALHRETPQSTDISPALA
jgi:hypothetical protein